MNRCYIIVIVVWSVILFLVTPVRAGFVLGAFDSTRATTANFVSGIYTTEALASFQAHFPSASIVVAPTLTPQFLSGVNTLILGSPMTDGTEITPLSASEQTALFNFVNSGGNAFLVADGWSPYEPADNSMIAPFGMSMEDDGLLGLLNATPTTQASPIINGPFGDTTSFTLYGAGVITNLGPYAIPLANEDLLQLPVLAVIPRHAISPTSGSVVIVTDSQFMIDDTQGGFFPQQQALFLNAMNYVSTPEPGSATLTSIALLGAGLAALGQRWKKRERGAG